MTKEFWRDFMITLRSWNANELIHSICTNNELTHEERRSLLNWIDILVSAREEWIAGGKSERATEYWYDILEEFTDWRDSHIEE